VKCAVYEIIEDGKPVYVGAAVNPARRLRYHKAKGKVAPEAAVRVVRWFASRRAALSFEAKHIFRTRPPRNGHHNCRAACGRVRMPTEQAFRIWHKNKRRPAEQVLELMPGWTYGMARYHFGVRGRPYEGVHAHMKDKCEGFTTARAYKLFGKRL
jgi:hypothetical protein